jgi:hypothetical protein
MKTMQAPPDEGAVLEKAAKYICNFREGLCPMVVEGFSCKRPCTEETLPWHCWIELFRERSANVAGGKSHEDHQPKRPVI